MSALEWCAVVLVGLTGLLLVSLLISGAVEVGRWINAILGRKA